MANGRHAKQGEGGKNSNTDDASTAPRSLSGSTAISTAV
jgi:hypothetical protein